jgi:hypothetical protein
VIPEIDIWRAANLMLKRYGEKAVEESAPTSSRPPATTMARDLAPDHRRGRTTRQQRLRNE